MKTNNRRIGLATVADETDTMRKTKKNALAAGTLVALKTFGAAKFAQFVADAELYRWNYHE